MSRSRHSGYFGKGFDDRSETRARIVKRETDALDCDRRALDKPARSCDDRDGLAGGTLDVSSSAQRARADDARPQCTDRELSADIFLLDTPDGSVRSWKVDDATFDALTDAIEHPRAPSATLIALFRKR
jgi:hypothetical protein